MRGDAWFGADRPLWKRAVARAVATGNRLLHAVPPLRWWYRRQLRCGLRWTRLEVPVEGCEALDGLRAVFVSDVHLGSFLVAEDLRALLQRVVALRPDLVLLGGDLVHTRSEELDAWRRELADLPASGIRWFAVPGNHERFPGIGIERFREVFSEAGVEVLLDAGLRVETRGSGGSLWVAGIDDLAEGRPDPEAALRGRRAGEPVLMLSHHPDCFDDLAARVPDGGMLVLAGHTHGGQIAPGGRVLMRHSERGYHRGLHRSGAASLYVGRGVGAAILPVRLGAPPEVVVLDWARGCANVEICDTAVGLGSAASWPD